MQTHDRRQHFNNQSISSITQSINLLFFHSSYDLDTGFSLAKSKSNFQSNWFFLTK